MKNPSSERPNARGARGFACLIVWLLFAECVFAEQQVTESPERTFRIVQQSNGEGWKQTLHFTGEQTDEILLEAGISWAALYYVSPDERWILRIQKSGSGDNISYLYRVDLRRRLWKLENELATLGFEFLRRRKEAPSGGVYHTGIKFRSWNMKRSHLHFSIHASTDRLENGVERNLVYDLKGQEISVD